MRQWVKNYLVIPLFLPFLLLWLLLARIISLISPLLILPSVILARKLHWAIPLAPIVLKNRLFRIGFEANYCINVVRRFLTLPLRTYTPDVYIIGFPKCGTTALATYLLKHPAIAGIDGLRWHPLLNKESHFFNGILGRKSASSSPAFYRSFFPTFLERWWREVFRRSNGFFCLDACPITGCLPYAAKRIAAINPNAKIVVMVRNPLEAIFSTEIMFRNLGVDLDWSFMEDVIAADPRFADTPDDAHFWEELAELAPEDPLPADLPARLFFRCSTVLRCAKYYERLKPFLEVFPRENIMIMDLNELNSNPQETVGSVLNFIGVNQQIYKFKPLPIVSGDRRGRRMHPAVRKKLQNYFAVENQRLFAYIGRDLHWDDSPTAAATNEEVEGGSVSINFPVIPVINAKKKDGRPHASPGKLARPRPVATDLLPGTAPLDAPLPGRKDSKLVKRVVSISAQV